MYEIYLRNINISQNYAIDDVVRTNYNIWSSFFSNPTNIIDCTYGEEYLLSSDALPDEIYKVTEAKLTMEDNASGSLEVTVPPTNECYNHLKCMLTEARVYKDSVEIWRGRLLTVKEDFWKCRKCVFEGELSYLCDTSVSNKSYIHASISENITDKHDRGVFLYMLDDILKDHNKRVEPYKRFYVDNSSLPATEFIVDNAWGASYLSINSKSTLDAIKQIAIDKNKLHLSIVHGSTGTRYLKLQDESQFYSNSAQEINFGENLMDFVKETKGFDQCTAIIPRGKKLESSKSEEAMEVEKYVEIPHTSNYLYDQDGLKLFIQGFDPNTTYVDKSHPSTNIVYDIKGMLKYGFVLGIVNWDNIEGDNIIVYEDDPDNPLVAKDPNPKEEGLYEKNEQGEYYLTKDTKVDYDTCYYKKVTQNGKEKYEVVEPNGKKAVTKPGPTSEKLVKKAISYFKKAKYTDVSSVEVTAMDLHYLNPDIHSFELTDRVHCVSEPHGLDVTFPVTKITLDLLNPENTKYTLGGEVKSLSSATSENAKNITTAHTNTEEVPKQMRESQLMSAAKDVSANMIIGSLPGSYASFLYNEEITVSMDGKTMKYPPSDTLQMGVSKYGVSQIEIGHDANGNPVYQNRAYGLVIRDGPDDAHSSNRWLWASGGLMHQAKGNDGNWKNPNLALTKDGHIVAERISAGQINIYTAGSTKPGQHATALSVYGGDNGTDLLGKWSTNGIEIYDGKIDIKTVEKVNGENKITTRFQVSKEGKLTAVSGKFTGDISASNIKGSTITGSTLRTRDVNDKGKQVNITKDSIEIFNTTNKGSGYLRLFQGENHGDGYDKEFGIASDNCHARWYDDEGGHYVQVESKWIVLAAKAYEESH